MITVYTTENCNVCTLTKKILTKSNVIFSEKSLENEPEIVEEATSRGATSAPIVVNDVTGEWISGFRPEKLREMISTLNDNTH